MNIAVLSQGLLSRIVVELFSGQKRFSLEFSGQLNTCFFFPFSPASLTELCPFFYGLKDLFPLINDLVVSDRSKLTMPQAVEGTWIREGSCGRFRGERDRGK